MLRRRGSAAVAIFFACQVAGCLSQRGADTGPKASADAAGPEGEAPSADAMAVDGAGTLDAGAAPTDPSVMPDAPVTVQPAPMPCDADASDDAGGDYCPPPLSVCADDVHLVYFDWGTCVSGWCVWPQKVTTCRYAVCSKAACISTITAPAM
jgi:hypothetical protein